MYGVVQKFGRIPDIDNGDTNEDVWDGEGAYGGFLSAAITMTVSSSSTDDENPSTGAWRVAVVGLDTNHSEVTQAVNLTGQTAVTLSTDLIRVYRAWVVTAGSDEENAGDIWVGSGTVTSGVPANKYAGILTEKGQTLMAIYTIPTQATKGGKIVSWYGTIGAGPAAYATIALQTKEFGGAWRTRRAVGIAEGSPPDPIDLTWENEEGQRVGGIDLQAKADVRIRTLENGVNNSSIEAGFNMELYS